MLSSANYQFDMLTSPLFKKSWLDPPARQLPDLELASLHEEQNFAYPLKDMDSTWQSGEHWNADGTPELQPFRGSFAQNSSDAKLDQETTPVESNNQSKQLRNFLKFNDESSDFNLEKEVRKGLMESSDFTEIEKRKYLGILSGKLKKPLSLNKQESISRYMEKKKRRKYVCQVKYKIRQDLACRRLRVKGKFVKTSKMDLLTAANILLISLFIRRQRRRAAQRSFLQR